METNDTNTDSLLQYFDSVEYLTLEHFVTTEVPKHIYPKDFDINPTSVEVFDSQTPTSESQKLSTTSSTSSSNNSGRHLLSVIEADNVDSVYEGLIDKKMWTLSCTGRRVEKVMQQCANENKLEHIFRGAHSMIMDPLDPIWSTYFTEEEREEIINLNPPKLPPLSSKMEKYLQQFDNLNNGY
ncbi:hypothetical protein BDB00DRAFT_793695 [Zychaea mexicana]|uniref:uncharacterized protein n=1 Tax=Zychaea mexicana TaxID=64656 RepID=UPI0022FF2FB5|nr:uncharacterized protein BDB00DRAFT_793695 [Zychaea mexicana]KAI9469305.1 hypothetical protein BDB00DRAFT_793695 [Zychaea mexicana]